MAKRKQTPKVLLYDLETAPSLIWAWSTFQTNAIATEKEWEILSFAYKWLGEKEIYFHSRETFRQEKRLIRKIHSVISKADILIAHNGLKFDNRKSNAKFLQHKINPPPPTKTIDTLNACKAKFALNSYSLGSVCEFLGLGKKSPHEGFPMWKGCMNNVTFYWRKMEKYNRHDIVLLEKLYLRIRPWISTHPNVAHLSGKPEACPRCGDERLRSRGEFKTATMTYMRYRCVSCRGYAKGRVIKTVKPIAGAV